MDPDKLRALSNFYREEFERHLEQLQQSGIPGCDEHLCGFMRNLDSVCCRSGFASVAEGLLQRFDALTRLSETDRRQGH